MQPGDRLLCAFVDPYERGARFVSWALHVTIIPWFRLSLPVEQLMDALRDLLQGTAQFEAKTAGEALFGNHGSKLVNLVELPSPLQPIERQVQHWLHEQHARLVDETTRKRREYQPHVTVQGTLRLYQGDHFICNAVYVVEQCGGYKEIIGKVELV